MNTKRMVEWFTKTYPDIAERKFAISGITTAVTLLVILIWDIFIGEPLVRVITLALSLVAAWMALVFFLYIHRASFGATLISIVIVCVVVPLMFFTGDGIYGCTPLWIAFAFMYIGINLKGRRRPALIILLLAVTVGCYMLACARPDLLIHHVDMAKAYLDSGASLVAVGVLSHILIGFLVEIYDGERNTAETRKKEIESLNLAQSRFFSSMSHEIRTPINTIVGLNEMILREDISPEVADDAKNIESASKMLLQLINDILDMSKIEAGKLDLTPIAYDVGDMLSDIVGMLWVRAKEKGLQFHVDLDPHLPSKLYGDEMRIKQVLINVLTNAIKYTKEGSVNFTIQCERTEDNKAKVVYSISDTGIGIKKENIPYLFSAFKRVDEEKNRHIEGTGLGLAIVKEYVDLMGGNVTVNSVYTQGTTFIVEIPQEVADSREIGELNIEERHEMNERTHYKRRFEAPEAKILVVDDNSSNIMVVTKLLRDTKVNVDSAKSGEEALKKAFSKHYHVIFMDHLMPGMDGIECMHKIREQVGGLCNDSKIIALTANAGSENKALYAREGFDGYLVKPVSGDELEKELIRMLPKEIVQAIDFEARVELEGQTDSAIRVKRVSLLITTDSVCDLPADILKQNDIRVIPYYVSTDKGLFLDGKEINCTEMIDYMTDNPGKAKAMPPTSADYEAFFAKQLLTANNVIHISMAGSESEGYAIASEAAQTFDNVSVINSGHLSSGLGLMVLAAHKMVVEGYTPDRILKELPLYRNKISTGFMVRYADSMARAGKINKAFAVASDFAFLHPIMILKDSRLTLGRIFFGTFAYAQRRYIKESFAEPDRIDTSRLFITHSGLDAEQLREIKRQVEMYIKFDEIIFQKASPAITANCGPGSFGLLYTTI
ncbi:MAG: DegV family EDD domain-containing protein [Lachnospiraceae bacterium]|nr:DegV family EDD domain-containing protein [Lachnospiraceae bacterium]